MHAMTLVNEWPHASPYTKPITRIELAWFMPAGLAIFCGRTSAADCGEQVLHGTIYYSFG